MNETLDDIDINRKNLPIFLYNLDQHKHLILIAPFHLPLQFQLIQFEGMNSMSK